MAENSESSTGAPVGKGNSGRKAKIEYGKINFRIPADYERALRYAALMSEKTPNAISKAEDMVVDAVGRYIEMLRKKGMEFPDAIFPTKPA